MIPLSDENPTLRTPVVTIGLCIAVVLVWVFIQGAGFDTDALAASVCNLGLIPGEITGLAPPGTAVPIGEDVACVVDRDPINVLTPVTSMFLHGSWLHLLGNCLFLWVFGNNVEDGMGRLRYLIFYLLCGLVAAGAQTLIHPASPMPMVGASGAISGVLGAYLVLYPHVRVRTLFIWVIFIQIISVPAWVVLLLWIALQFVAAFAQLSAVEEATSGGVALWAHIGGFVAGLLLAKPFENQGLTQGRLAHERRDRTAWRWPG